MSRLRGYAPWIALGIVYVVWGSTYMGIRIVVRELPPFASAGLRFLVAGLIMTALAAARHGSAAWPRGRQWLDYAVVGLLLFSGGNALVVWAQQRLPSGMTALIVAITPLWVTLLDGLRPGGRPWSLRVLGGVLLGIAGVALIARPGTDLSSADLTRAAGLLAAGVVWSAGSLYAQSIRRPLPLLAAAALEMLVGGAAMGLESLLSGEDASRLLHASRSAWLAIAYLVVFGSVVAFTAFAYCLQQLPATTVSTYAYVNPVVAVLLGWLFLGETVSRGLVGGGVLILAAVLLTAGAPRPREGSVDVAEGEGAARTARDRAGEARPVDAAGELASDARGHEREA